tara:strand:- start:354 stop:644 length:291 start_codon:yes stop_codon:yes gene_type:complete
VTDLNDSIESLGKKTDAVIDALRKTRIKIDQLNKDKERLNKRCEDEAKRILELKEENKVLKLAAAIKGNEETVSDSKRKISQMMREIDRCIAKLND